MAKYKSRFLGLSFSVGDKLYRFENGEFTSEDVSVLAVLDEITDVTRVDEEPKTEAKAEPTATKPAAKAPAKRTASTK